MHGYESREMDKPEWYSKRPQNLESFNDLKGWRIDEGDVDVRGWKLEDENGNDIGKIDDFLVDTDTGQAIFLVVTHGGLMGVGGKKTLIPMDQIDIDKDNKRCILKVTADHLKDAPEYKYDTESFDVFYDFWGGTGSMTSGLWQHGERREHEEYGRTMGETGETHARPVHWEGIKAGEVRGHEEAAAGTGMVGRRTSIVRIRRIVEVPVEVAIVPEDEMEEEDIEETRRTMGS